MSGFFSRRTGRAVGSLVADRSGNFGLMFALISVPVLVALGCSFDYVQALNINRKMQSDLDAALVAAVQNVGTKDPVALKKEIGDWLEAEAAQKGYYVLNANAIDIDTSSATIKADASATVPTTFLQVAGIKSIPVSVASAVVGGQTISKTALSMYLVLDRSGSMAEPTATSYTTTCPNGSTCTKIYTKIEALKLAVNSLMAQLLTADPDKKYVRTGAVSYNISMQSPSPLAWGESAAQAYVQALTAKDGTNSGEAFKTAYQSVSDPSEDTAHMNKNGTKPEKYIVFMTDGNNNEKSYDTETEKWCDQARANKVTVYTIAFMAPDNGQALLKYCATTSDDYFPAESTADLVNAFKAIGETSSKNLVRLTQ